MNNSIPKSTLRAEDIGIRIIHQITSRESLLPIVVSQSQKPFYLVLGPRGVLRNPQMGPGISTVISFNGKLRHPYPYTILK
jgi:hypothetical protein